MAAGPLATIAVIPAEARLATPRSLSHG